MMKNYIIFCPKCRFYVGAFDKGDYFQCSRNKNHKIIKNEEKNDRKNR